MGLPLAYLADACLSLLLLEYEFLPDQASMYYGCALPTDNVYGVNDSLFFGVHEAGSCPHRGSVPGAMND